MNENDQASTRVVGALVVHVDIERWSAVKKAVEAVGARILYQRLAPLGVYLHIVERDARGARP